MEVCSIISSVIGALCSANTRNLFSSITHRGGNEQKIDEIVNILKTVLTDKGLMNHGVLNAEKSTELRKVTFFLILNSDFEQINELANSDDLVNLIWAIPVMPQCLLMNIIWELNLTDYFCEAIQYCSFDLSFELTSAAAKNVKHLEIDKCLSNVSKLISSTYQQKVSIFHKVLSYKNFTKRLNSTHDILNELLKFYTDPPNKSKIMNQSTYKLYLYVAKSLLNLFTLLNTCLKSFTKRSNESPGEAFEIYSSTFIQEEDKQDKSDILFELENFFKKTNDRFLDVAKANVMAVNVDMFCTWCEFEDEIDKSKNLQRRIGETVYELINVLKSDERFEHEVISMLPSIAIKPMDTDDHIAAASKETLIENCFKESADREQWLHALISRDSFLTEDDSITCAIENSKLFKIDDSKHLISKGFSAIRSEIKLEHNNLIKKLIFTIFMQLQNEDKLSLISEMKLSDDLELDDFEAKLAEFCNKLIEVGKDDLSMIYGFFVQNPKKFIKKILTTAVSSEPQLENAVQILEICKKFENENISNIIFQELEELRIDQTSLESTKTNYINLMAVVCSKSIIGEETLFSKLIMPNISDNLNSNDGCLILIYLKILDRVYLCEKHPNYAAPLVVMFAQILENFRWSVQNFNPTSVAVVDWVTNYVLKNITIMKNIVEENRQQWLLGNLSFLTPINAYYFQSLLPKTAHKKFVDISLEAKELETCLNFLLPRSTYDEFNLIFDELEKKSKLIESFDMLCNGIKNVSSEAEDLKSPEAFECLKYCINNAALIFNKRVLFKESDIEGREYLKNIFNFIKSIHAHVYFEAFTTFLPSIPTILNHSLDKNEDLSELEALLINAESKEIFRKMCTSR